MGSGQHLSHGDTWEDHYRGYRLQVSPNGDIWWQLYEGTDRLYLEPPREKLAEDLLALKRLGGRVRITEDGDIITQVEREDEGYDPVWVGTLDLEGELVPEDVSEYGIPVRPEGLDPGDLWPTVYDGARYSYSGGDRVWWQNPNTHKRHPVETDLSADVFRSLKRYKPDGGSFRVTPWGDLITLVPFHPTSAKVEDQFEGLPLVVKNIVRLRKEQGVEMLPLYIGRLGNTSFEVQEPDSLTDELSDAEQAGLSSWARNLGSTRSRSVGDHTTSSTDGDSDSTADDDIDEETVQFDDDPIEWQDRDFDMTD